MNRTGRGIVAALVVVAGVLAYQGFVTIRSLNRDVKTLSTLWATSEQRVRELENRRIAADERAVDDANLVRDLQTRRADADEWIQDASNRLRNLDLVQSDRQDAVDGADAALAGLRALQTAIATQNQIIRRQTQASYPPLTGERGVVNAAYVYGDVRRYGITPDGKTNWEATGAVDAVVANSSLLGLEIFWPPGFYRTSLNISRSNVSFRFAPGAEFAGVIHVTDALLDGKIGNPPIRNIIFHGPLVTYDRFGTINVRGLVADDVILKSDRTKNLQGELNRGAHIYFGSRDFSIKTLTVDKGEGAGRANMHAAVSIDGFGDNPRRIRIGQTWIKDTPVHGMFVTGPDHEFGAIQIDGYCAEPGRAILQDTDPEAAAECKGVWFNKASGTVKAIDLSEPDRPMKAAYGAYFDGPEIRWAPPWDRPIVTDSGMTVGTITLRNAPPRPVGMGKDANASVQSVVIE